MELIRAIAAGTMLRVRMYLEDMGKTECFDKFSELYDVMEALDEQGLKLLETEERCPDSPYYKVIQLLGGEREGQNLLDFAVTVLLYPQFGAILKSMSGNVVTVELAYFMENIEAPSYGQMRNLYERGGAVLKPESNTELFFHTSFYADNRLLGYLCMDEGMDERLRGIAELFSPGDELEPLVIRQDICGQLVHMEPFLNEMIIIKGEEGAGKRFLLCHAFQQLGRKLIFAEISEILKRKQDISELMRLIRREALFHSCAICIHGITQQVLKEAELTATELLHMVVEPCRQFDIPVYFCTDIQTELLPYLSVPVNQFVLSEPKREERIRLWNAYGERYGLMLDSVQLGTKYKFTPKQIQRACIQLRAKQEKETLTEGSIADVLSGIMPPVLTKGSIEPYHPNCTLDDLVLPEEMKTKIRDICAHVWYSHKVYDEWNMESKYAYGKAVSVLLTGPPGTGKTMTARVIADMLRLPLYHVNLSQIVDKYIGETEKHLEEIFSNAERSNIILFFDEADAVFGKRSEVADAKDKYANTEVSYILQRIEAYDGIVILSTNYKGNIDAAFMRRIQYILNFHLPDEEERLSIWKGCFPKESPLEEVDFEYLAKQFEFSGSSIKNVVLTAAFLAAQEGGAISMKHIVGGIKNEYVKNGKPVFSAELGRYAYLL